MNKRGNPAWVKGKSANPKGRPREQTSLEALLDDWVASEKGFGS